MSWSAPTAADVLSELTPAEATKFQNVLGGASTTEKVEPILDRAVAEIRGAIIAGGYAVDDDESLIPKSLLSDSIAIARWRLITSLPDVTAVESDARRYAFERSLEKLDKIAAQEWSVEPPTEPPPGATSVDGNWNSEVKLTMRTNPGTYANP
jgi:hypothetical protein